MPSFRGPQFNLTIIGRDETTFARALFHLNVNSVSGDDRALFNLTITNALLAAYTSGVVRIGAAVEIDLGTGTAEDILVRDLGSSLSLAERLRVSADDGADSDTARFTMIGDDLSPLVNITLASARSANVIGYYGTDGAIESRTLLSGVLIRGGWQTAPKVATIDLLDNAAIHQRKRVVLEIEGGSLRTRGSMVREICAALGMTIEYADFGPGDGGQFVKPKFEGGTAEVFNFLTDQLSPRGVVPQYIGGELWFKRWTPKAAEYADVTLTARDVAAEITIAAPDTNAVNKVTATGSSYDHTAIEDGTAGASQQGPVTTTGDYTPLGGEFRPINNDGDLVSTGFVPSPAYATLGDSLQHKKKISEVLTTVRKTKDIYGGTITTTIEETYEWYAPFAAPLVQDNVGPTVTSRWYTFLSDAMIWGPFLYADGTWRSRIQEKYQLVQRVVTVEKPDEYVNTSFVAGQLPAAMNTLRRVYAFSPLRRAYAYQSSGVGFPPLSYDCYMTENGDAWDTTNETVRLIEEVESIKRAQIDTNAGTYGPIVSETTITRRLESPYTRLKQFAFYYGPSGNPTYRTTQTFQMMEVERRVVGYIPTANSSGYSERQTTTGFDIPKRVRTEEFVGSPPSFPSSQDSAEVGKSTTASATYTYATGVSMNGTHIGEVTNEACESAAELYFVAREAVRQAQKTVVNLKTKWDVTMHKGDTVIIDVDGFELAGEPLLLVGIQREIDLRTTQYSQSLELYYYPPELRT